MRSSAKHCHRLNLAMVISNDPNTAEALRTSSSYPEIRTRWLGEEVPGALVALVAVGRSSGFLEQHLSFHEKENRDIY
jgi:hypothetical protein